jgi:hypothetical protein
MTYKTTTTLTRVREAFPCTDGWTKLLAHLGKTQADDEPLELLAVLDSNGYDDALWVLSRAMPDDRLARHFQAWCADQVLHVFEAKNPGDTRVRDQIAMLRNDDATDEERAAARRAALSAAWHAPGHADWAAAKASVRDSGWEAENLAAWAAAWTTLRYDASEEQGEAAHHAARVAQEAQLRKMLSSIE